MLSIIAKTVVFYENKTKSRLNLNKHVNFILKLRISLTNCSFFSGRRVDGVPLPTSWLTKKKRPIADSNPQIVKQAVLMGNANQSRAVISVQPERKIFKGL